MLKLGRRSFDDDETLLMAIVNRTPDSFYDLGATFDEGPAYDRVAQVVEEGAHIVDIGGVRAGGRGGTVSVTEELRRVTSFVGRIRADFADVVISVDTWRAEVARAVCAEGADLLNDAWGGFDPGLYEVAAEYDVAVVCSHAGGRSPRTDPYRFEYDDLVGTVIAATTALAERAVAAGVDRRSVMIDPAHDIAKNTFHSLELTRRLDEMVATGWPVLVSLSNKNFIGEALDAPLDQRVPATLATTAYSALAGARVFRVHEVGATRDVLDMLATIQGRRAPARAIRGLQ